MAAARVLVVDDEPSIVGLVEATLVRRGYEVVAETSPRRALELVRGRGRQIDLIISDVVMPEMTGPELVHEVRQISPSTIAMLMSGFADPKELPPGVTLLQKPFSPTDLFSRVESVLREAFEAVESLKPAMERGKQLLAESRKCTTELREAGRVAQAEVERLKAQHPRREKPVDPGAP